MRSLESPQFLSDLYRDLRDRRLLPVVILLAASLAIVPIALSKPAPESSGAVSAAQSAAAAAAEDQSAEQVTVVVENTGLRDYRERLDTLKSKDPFQQHFTAPQLAGSELNEPTSTAPTSTASTGSAALPSGSASSPSSSSSTTPSSDPYSSPLGSPDGDGEPTRTVTKVETETKYVDYEVDVRIVRDGKAKVVRDVQELTMLPGDKAPVVVFMGVSPDTEKALFLPSEEVTGVFGDVKCVTGAEECQLLMLEPGFPVTFTYGERDRSYRISVLKIERVDRADPGGGSDEKN